MFNNHGTVASIQKQNRNVQADQVKADKAVVEALKTVAHWVAKLLLTDPTTPRPLAALGSPDSESLLVPIALVSPIPEVEVIPRRRGIRQGTKRRQTQVMQRICYRLRF